MDLAELLQHITDAWPARFERGLVTHIHRNHLRRPDGSLVHLRVLIQQTAPPQEGANDAVDLKE